MILVGLDSGEVDFDVDDVRVNPVDSSAEGFEEHKVGFGAWSIHGRVQGGDEESADNRRQQVALVMCAERIE